MSDNKVSSKDIEKFINDLYDLRKTSIAKDGEYGLGNLVFKEFRNLGYLKTLKTLRKELKSRELSLESLTEDNKVKKALFGDYTNKIRTFAILTAENPFGVAISPSENNKLTSELKRRIKQLNLQYIDIQGMFRDKDNPTEFTDVDKKNYGDSKYMQGKSLRKEHSVMIINCSKNDAIGLAALFKQQSLFFGTVEKVDKESTKRKGFVTIEYLEVTPESKQKVLNGESTSVLEYRVVDTTKDIVDAKDFENYFSKYKDFQFSIDMSIFKECLNGLMEIKEDSLFEDTINDNVMSNVRRKSRLGAYVRSLK